MATTRKLCYPHPKDADSHVSVGWHPPIRGLGPLSTGLHETSGLAHNWALDFMAKGGTKILAVEAATVWKLSGHDPKDGVIDGDIFGWNTYLMTKDGLIYFYTHQGSRSVKVGDRVVRGQIIGVVGKWPDDPGRSHTHLGVTFPAPPHPRSSQRAIVNVGEAPRLAVV